MDEQKITSAPEAEEPKKDQPSAYDDEKHRVIAALGYIPLLCILPIVMRHESDFLTFHARQGVVVTMLAIVMAIFGPFFTILIPFFGLLIALVLDTLVALLILVGAWKAYQGERWEMPLFGEYAKTIKL